MKRKNYLGLLFLLLTLSLTMQAGETYNVKKYGAKGNGRKMDSPAIQKAIDACHKAGGGTVIVPAGTYLSATIVLKDNVTLRLEKDALILGTTDYKAYDNLDPFTEGLGIDVGWALMVAVDAKNVTLEGEGTIDGQGSALKARHIKEDTRPEGQRWGLRPFLLRWVRCENVKVEGVTLKYAGAWTSHYFQCRNVNINNITIRSFGVAHNDGINIDGCQHVRISNCDIISGDDALCFKTTSSKMGCDDIIITNMKLKSNQAGIKMGTESMAGFENIKIEGNCIYIDNPIVMQMDEKYGGGEIFKYTFAGRISEVGIANMCLESEFEHYEDNHHAWIGVQFDKVENCWARNLTCRYFGYAAVSCERYAKNVTVANCRCLETKSIITGGLRYSFNNWGQQNLFMNCQSTEGRHDYVTGARVCGPNVFYNCTAFQTYADIGPHHRWAVGTLYDNIITDGEINVQDRGQMGSGHGWAGVTQVLWNCRAKRAAVQNPWTSGNNYNIGMKGQKYPGHFTNRPEGIWEGQNELNVFPRSLYIAQLMARHRNMDLLILMK